jgi:hypothetical protein
MNDIDINILEDKELEELKPEYDEIPSIDSETMKLLRKQDIKSLKEKLMLEKFFFQQSIEDIDNKDDENMLWKMYIEFSGRNKFRNIKYEKGLINQTLNMKNVLDTTMPLIASKMGIQLDMIQNISKWYNLKHSQNSIISLSSF